MLNPHKFFVQFFHKKNFCDKCSKIFCRVYPQTDFCRNLPIINGHLQQGIVIKHKIL